MAAALNAANDTEFSFANAIWWPTLPELCSVTSTQPAGISIGQRVPEVLRVDRDLRAGLHRGAVVVVRVARRDDLLLLPQQPREHAMTANECNLPAATESSSIVN